VATKNSLFLAFSGGKLMYEYKAKVIRIVNGDTFVLSVETEPDVWMKRRCVLFGVIAPEIRVTQSPQKEAAQKVIDRVTELLKDVECTIKIHGYSFDGYSYITLYVNGMPVNDVLVSEGLVKPI
jgi:endonuclease YncB( thermonuclease family)